MSVIKTIVWTLAGVAAINLAGLGISLAFGHSVTLVIDNQTSIHRVVTGTVATVLSDQRVSLSARDVVDPDLSTPITKDMTITVRHCRPVDLTLNGTQGTYWTFATTVGEVLKNLGLSETASLKISAPPETPIGTEGISLIVKTGFTVTVTAGGTTQSMHAFGTVQDALFDLGLAWTDTDILTPQANTILSADLSITLVRVTTEVVTRDKVIPRPVDDTKDHNAPEGHVQVITEGADGAMIETVEQVLHDGQVASETVLTQKVTREPVTRVTITGTKPNPAFDVTPGSAQAIAYDMVLARGWDDGQFQCLVNLWNRESGWRVNAANPSGAYGIPQALPGSKMASAGADWQTNPATQITWGLGYIQGRYGTPCGAWSAFLSQGWY